MAVTTVTATDAPLGEGPGIPPPRKRRWPRRLLLGLNIFVGVCLLAAASVYGYVWYQTGKIGRVSVPSLFGGGSADPGQPMNILIVGSDSRAFVDDSQDATSFGSQASNGGARSDTTMIVHLDPRSETATLLSIPRDLWVPIADKGYSQRINTAFDSGPDLLVRTIQDDLGIPINHYMDVDFQTFRDVVNAIGGVKFWYPEPVHDTYSGLNITTPGCYGLDGNMALELVRARHMTYEQDGRWLVEGESDLARIRRQQLFVRRVISKLEGSSLANITSVNGIVNGIVSNLTVDSGFSVSSMLKLARRYRSFDPNKLQTMTLPTTAATIGGADVLLPVKEQDDAVVSAFLEQNTSSSSSPSSTAPTPAALVQPSQVTVRVRNGSGRTGEATATVRDLRAVGYGASIDGTGKADNYNYATTTLRYNPADTAEAQTLASSITGGATLQSDSSLPAGGGVIMITGQSYGGVHTPSKAAAAPASAGNTPTTAPPTSSNQAAFPGIHGADPAPPGSGC